MVPDAYPPKPFVMSHCRWRNSGSLAGSAMVRSILLTKSGSWKLIVFIRLHQDCRVSWNNPIGLGFERRRASAAIFRRFARPERPPTMLLDRRQERFRCGIQIQPRAEIDQEKAVVALS